MKKVLVLLLSVVLLLSMVGCSSSTTSSDNANETTFEKVKREGSITIGFANEKPYAYKTPEGELTGEAVEVARAVFKNLGVNEINGVLTEFGSLIPGLQAKRFDTITAGMFITKDRCKEVAFANPEYSIGEAIAVKAGNPMDIHSYTDIIDNPEVKVGVMGGAIEYDYMIKSNVPKDQIVIVPDNPSALSALQSDRVDLITMTGPSLQSVLDTANDANIERVMDFEQPVIDGESVRGYGATAFRIEDEEFRQAFNKELEKMKESGELLEIIKPFGFTEQELPGDATTDNLCNK